MLHRNNNDGDKNRTDIVMCPELNAARRDPKNTREKTLGVEQRRKDDVRRQLGKIPSNVRNICTGIFAKRTQIILLILKQLAHNNVCLVSLCNQNQQQQY